MYCSHCGKLCDFQEGFICSVCKDEINRINERVYHIVLLSECYRYIPDIALRKKIEAIIFPKNPLA